MTIQQAYQQLVTQLYEVYDDREAAHIGDWVIEHITGKKRIDRITDKNFPLTQEMRTVLQQYTAQLLQHRPVQYVLHEAWFAGMAFYVDEHVLIPRPETEELTEWLTESLAARAKKNIRILDIGTGSGCIPVTLAKKITAAEVHALDVSAGALQVAQRNAATQHVNIHFHQADILDAASWNGLPRLEVIVSNPPYIKQSEEAAMQRNVLAWEPHLALFVPDNDALLFYRAIAVFGKQYLLPDGWLFLEINEALAAETVQLLQEHGYITIDVKKDMQGKERMIRARRKP